MISTVEKIGNNFKYETYGVSIISDNTGKVELYVDTLSEAFKKGILSNDMKNKLFNCKTIGYAFLALIVMLMILVTGGLAFIGIVILSIFIYPIQYLINKKRFNKIQQKMLLLNSIFENEFEVINKTITKDWISFWGQVKSDISDEVKLSLPFSY